MWDILKFPSDRINYETKKDEKESFQLLWWEEVFKLKKSVKEEVEEIEESVTEADELPDFAELLILYNSIAVDIKGIFEKKYGQEIKKSAFDKEVSEIITTYATTTLEFKTDIYSWCPEWYIRSLYAKKLKEFEAGIEKILIENFSSIWI